MKRHLKHERYLLSDRERAEIWRSIDFAAPGRERRPRPRFALATGLVLATAAVACVTVWWTATREATAPGAAPHTTPVELVSRAEPEPSLPEIVLERVGENDAQTPGEGDAGTTQAAAPAAAEADAPPRASLRGRIVGRDSGQPLANATVLLVGTSRSVVTDRDGRFAFPGLDPADSARLEVRYPGYDTIAVAFGFADTDEAGGDIAMAPVVVASATVRETAGSEQTADHSGAANEPAARPQQPGTDALAKVEERPVMPGRPVERGGELFVRGGRSGDAELKVGVAGQAPVPAQAWGEAKSLAASGATRRGSVTGGTTPPNGASAELMYFEHTGVNPFVATEEDALSTFAVDVDGASWAVTRNYLEHDELPPAAAVRVEEFVNAFDPGWPGQSEADLGVHVDGAPSRFGRGYELLRIGIAGRELPREARRTANLIFVVDVSGSMGREDRLGAVRQGLTMLLDELQEGDRVGLVVYGSRGEVRLQPTDISRRPEIQAAIGDLVPSGSTNAYEGLKLAYEMARAHYQADRINRLILCSDGVANNGATTVAEEMLALVRRSCDEGISLSTIGFGMGNYNDVLMEKLADKGDGNYAYVDRREEAERVFRENLTGMLETVAREAKVQVEFDPEYVERWRLIGYENRDVADRDFRNDAVDAGEIGAGHRVTAFYEVKLTDAGRETAGDLGVIRLRWEAPRHDVARAGEIAEIAVPMPRSALAESFGEAAPGLRLQAAVAEFAEILRGSFWAKEGTYEDVLAVVDGLAATEAGDGDAAEVARLVRAAARLTAAKEARQSPRAADER